MNSIVFAFLGIILIYLFFQGANQKTSQLLTFKKNFSHQLFNPIFQRLGLGIFSLGLTLWLGSSKLATWHLALNSIVSFILLSAVSLLILGWAIARWTKWRAWMLAGLVIFTGISSFNLEMFSNRPALAATESFAAGAYIVDMGQATQTVANGLKPYGLVYELIVKKAIPVKWAINPAKIKDGVDFTANGKSYKGSAFIIPPEYATEAAATIATWKTQGVVVDGPLSTAFSAPIYDTITSFPNSVLDLQKGSIAAPYFTNAGIPITSTGTFGTFNTYRSGDPSTLSNCDDVFIMPHADPLWASHKNLIPFNQSKGFIWAGCHAVSVLELVDDPADPDLLPNMNFLSTNKGLIKFGSHSTGTPPYLYDSSTDGDPIMQFMGRADAAMSNGSEQIYLPEISSAWRSSSKVAVYDEPFPDIPGKSPGRAAKMAYGSGFGNPNNGIVFYEGGHSINGTAPDNIAAQRAFLNFILLAGIARRVNITTNIPTTISAGNAVNVSATASGGSGIFSYQWYSSCGGTFANSTSANTTFTAPSTGGSCSLRVIVKDSCNRRAFGLQNVTMPPPSTDLEISKTDNITDTTKGNPIAYTITVKNNGPSSVSSVKITDTISPVNGLKDRVFTASTGTLSPASPTFNSSGVATFDWNGLNLAPGQSVTLTLNATVDIDQNSSPLTNTVKVDPPAGVTETNTANNTSSDRDAVLAKAGDVDLVLTKTHTPTSPQPAPGEQITYTITVTNKEATAVGSMILTDGLPPSILNPTYATRIVSGTTSAGTYNPATSQWTGLNLGKNGIVALDITAKVSPFAPTNTAITNKATVSPLAPATGTGVLKEKSVGDNTATDSFTPSAAKADFTIDKDDNQTDIAPGSAISYTISVTNNGPSAVTAVKVTDAVPSTIQSPVFIASEGTYNNSTGDWTGISLPPGKTIKLVLSGTVASNAVGTLTNTATVAPPTGVTDPISNNNSDTDTDNILPYADLTISKTDGKTTVNPGDTINYTITVTNNGPSTVTSVKVTDNIPADLSNISWNASTGSYNSTTGAWTGLNLATGQNITLTLSGKLSNTPAPVLKNTATVAPPTGVTDPNLENNSSTDSDATDPNGVPVDLEIVKTDNATSVSAGEPITYIITLKNKSATPVESVKITDVIPAAISDPIFSTPDGVYDEQTGLWTGLNLSNGSTATLIFDGSIKTSANGTLTNTVKVDPPVGFYETFPDDNTSTDTDTITNTTATPGLVLVKRITAIRGTDINTHVNDTYDNPDTPADESTFDNEPKWPEPLDSGSGISTYLQGEINGGKVKPGDEIEYTIYFLSNGSTPARNVKICDLIPTHSSFVSDTFGSTPQAGIQMAIGATTDNLTNASDTDGGEFLTAGSSTPSVCQTPNTNGAVLVQVVKPPVTLPADVNSPSYGFIRFRTKVN
jgi:large repetitive protein